MSLSMVMEYKIDLNSPLKTRMPVTLFMQGDNEANVLQITVMDGSEPASLAGCSAVCYLLRQDGTRVYNSGTINGNVAIIALNSACYAYPGSYAAFVRLTETDTGIKRTILRIAGTIENEGDGPIVDPSGKIPTYEELEALFAKMEAATDAGNQAASSANAAASSANDAASSANTASEKANTAADNANEAASAANSSAERAEAAAVSANEAATSANAATDAAQEAAESANTASSTANASAAKADEAAATAGKEAASANTAAAEASTAAESAAEAASRADTAASSIENMTVSETSVTYGAGVNASLTKDTETGAYHLAIQAEQGPGYTILGPAYATVEALAAAVPEPSEGDQYNVGDEPPYHIYRWTGGYWEDQGALQGPQGDPGPGIASGGTVGQVLRKSGEADYETVWGADSVVVYTQANYDALTTDDRAALYAQGVRLIVITGNSSGGITISLDADGTATRIGITADEVNTIVSSAVSAAKLAIYPVGSIYMSVDATSPGTLFGGTWEQLEDRFLLAAGSSYAAGTTGGEATHTLTESEMPSHTHKPTTSTVPNATTYNEYYFQTVRDMASVSTARHLVAGDADGNLRVISSSLGASDYGGIEDVSSVQQTASTGGSAAHNNMPPYLAVYMWKRTA